MMKAIHHMMNPIHHMMNLIHHMMYPYPSYDVPLSIMWCTPIHHMLDPYPSYDGPLTVPNQKVMNNLAMQWHIKQHSLNSNSWILGQLKTRDISYLSKKGIHYIIYPVHHMMYRYPSFVGPHPSYVGGVKMHILYKEETIWIIWNIIGWFCNIWWWYSRRYQRRRWRGRRRGKWEKRWCVWAG